jgi:hypothetical protein
MSVFLYCGDERISVVEGSVRYFLVILDKLATLLLFYPPRSMRDRSYARTADLVPINEQPINRVISYFSVLLLSSLQFKAVL